MKKIDFESWNRYEHYTFFKDLDMPRFLITVDLDVTQFVRKVKEKKKSFYLSLMHLVMQEINQMENFLYRMIGNDVYLLEKSHPSFTDIIEGTELFKFVTVNFESDLDTFLINAKQKSKDQGKQFIDYTEEQRFDLVYVTTFPWAKYSSVTHAYNIDKKDSVPKLAWGKFENVNGKLMMPFSIEVNHALVDGLHVGKLIQNIQIALNQ